MSFYFENLTHLIGLIGDDIWFPSETPERYILEFLCFGDLDVDIPLTKGQLRFALVIGLRSACAISRRGAHRR